MRMSDCSSDVCSSDLARELGVDRQPDRLVGVGAGQLHRELHPLAAAGHGHAVGLVLLDRQYLLEQRAQLHLAEGAAGLDVAEHALEVADADRQLLHLAQAALHRFPSSEEHTSELQTLMRTSYAVFCLKKKPTNCTSQDHTS